ncbi:MAG: lipocalin-like domain-containing protein [Alphaproteobacteria bacterium]|nr:lipocalin-like domain-containing protein [Alphaproteobacteria bacterium]
MITRTAHPNAPGTRTFPIDAVRLAAGASFVAALLMLVSIAGADPARAEPTFKQRLVGTWIFVSSVNTRKDGTIYDRWGASPKGVLMFDANGRYSQIIIRSEPSLFGGKTIFSFGTYVVDDASATLITEIEGGSLSKLEGTKQRRKIKLLTADELNYVNLDGMGGSVIDAVWKRAPAHQPHSATLYAPLR